MASPTVPWGIPQFDDNSPFAPVQAPLNAQSAALNVALNNGAFMPYATKALLDAAPGTRVGQHASVHADGTAANNGDYRWSGLAWERLSTTFAEAAGVANFSGTGGSSSAPIYWDNAVTVTFPAGRFTQPPIVTVSPRQTSAIVWPIISTAPTVNGFTVQGVRVGGLTTSAMSFSWHAVQMTASSAAG